MQNDTQYWLDHQNRIVKVNTAWNTFALENGAPELTNNRIVGRSLLHFIAGDDTRMLVTALVDSVRTRGKPIRHPYRCDSPDRRRYMEMYILPGQSGQVRLVHHIVSVESLVHPVKFSTVINGEARIARCSMCNQIRIGQEWMESDAAYKHKYLAKNDLKVVYRVCANCRSQVQAMNAHHSLLSNLFA